MHDNVALRYVPAAQINPQVRQFPDNQPVVIVLHSCMPAVDPAALGTRKQSRMAMMGASSRMPMVESVLMPSVPKGPPAAACCEYVSAYPAFDSSTGIGIEEREPQSKAAWSERVPR